MRLIDADDFGNRMYHEAFEKDTDMQKWDSGCWIRYKLFENVLREQPTAQPECERGHWIEGGHRKFIDLANADRQYTELGYPHRTYINMSCSNCGMITIVDASIRYDFCPHCGADMKEV